MDLGLHGRTAVVCASTSGLGEAIARTLAAEGANVVVNGRRAERAVQIAAELPRAIGVAADLTTPDGPDALITAAREAFGAVDICVLNGGGPPVSTAAGMSADEAADAVNSQALSHIRLVSLVLDEMRARRWGRIVAVSGRAILTPVTGLALSNVGRSALAAYLKTLANEVAADGVTVNLLLPGTMATARTESVLATMAAARNLTPADVEAAETAGIPAGRLGTPDEFAAAAAFLCSAAASYVTGIAMRCDGGQVPTL